MHIRRPEEEVMILAAEVTTVGVPQEKGADIERSIRQH